MIFKKREKFCNCLGEKVNKHFVDVVQIFWKSKTNFKTYFPEGFKISDWVDSKEKPSDFSHEPIITWIGHASFLIQVGGLNILTDPIFGDLSLMYPRNFAPGILPQHLPKVDVILISHNHRDHLDLRSLKFFKKEQTQIFVPMKVKKILEKKGYKNLFEFNWWDEKKIELNNVKNGTKVTFLPTLHWSIRGILDLNKSLWGSWMIESNQSKIYFGADSAYSDHYTKISKKFSQIDVAIMPIAPCEPRQLTKNTHMDAHESSNAFLDLNAKTFIPMHWGTFRLGTDSFDGPIKKLREWWDENLENLEDKILYIPKFGEKVRL